MKTLAALTLSVITFLAMSSFALAAYIPSHAKYERSPKGKNTSTAPGYGKTWHTIDHWQRLGSKWKIRDGVDWSVDGGKTWGFRNLTRGSQVIFRFNFQRPESGSHKYDQLKSWIDWNGDKKWNNKSEGLIATKIFKKHQRPGYREDGLSLYQKYFYAQTTVPIWASLGETWLRARVHCDDTPFNKHTPYSKMTQGEVEDYSVTIVTPEPSTFILLGAGLLGLVGLSRRRKA